jgi:hypothetical protein
VDPAFTASQKLQGSIDAAACDALRASGEPW